MLTLESHYVHCPACGRLDRHFKDTDRSSVFWACPCSFEGEAEKWVSPLEGNEWLVQLLGGTELSLVRRSYYHGRVSHGWFCKDKLLVAELGKHLPLGMREQFMSSAEEEAVRRNQAK